MVGEVCVPRAPGKPDPRSPEVVLLRPVPACPAPAPPTSPAVGRAAAPVVVVAPAEAVVVLRRLPPGAPVRCCC